MRETMAAGMHDAQDADGEMYTSREAGQQTDGEQTCHAGVQEQIVFLKMREAKPGRMKLAAIHGLRLGRCNAEECVPANNCPCSFCFNEKQRCEEAERYPKRGDTCFSGYIRSHTFESILFESEPCPPLQNQDRRKDGCKLEALEDKEVAWANEKNVARPSMVR